MLTPEEGEMLVSMARSTISSYLQRKTPEEDATAGRFSGKAGVFVTLKTYPGLNLRGCIGFTEPAYPLAQALRDAAIAAAARDPRFRPVEKDELDSIVVEVTVLTAPRLLQAASPEQYPSSIEVGRDGLIVELGFHKGLLLPQVPVEWGWDSTEFLSQTCVKAGLDADTWMTEDELKIFTFQGQIFSEESPGGAIAEGSRG